MSYIDEQTGLQVLPLAECVRLLEANDIARIAFVVDGAPQLYPVNYVWDGEAMVFRCESNSTMSRAIGGEFVAEIDGIDRRNRDGWSVIARGTPSPVDPATHPAMAARLERMALYPWAGGDKATWLRLIPAPLTGRRIARTT